MTIVIRRSFNLFGTPQPFYNAKSGSSIAKSAEAGGWWRSPSCRSVLTRTAQRDDVKYADSQREAPNSAAAGSTSGILAGANGNPSTAEAHSSPLAFQDRRKHLPNLSCSSSDPSSCLNIHEVDDPCQDDSLDIKIFQYMVELVRSGTTEERAAEVISQWSGGGGVERVDLRKLRAHFMRTSLGEVARQHAAPAVLPVALTFLSYWSLSLLPGTDESVLPPALRGALVAANLLLLVGAASGSLKRAGRVVRVGRAALEFSNRAELVLLAMRDLAAGHGALIRAAMEPAATATTTTTTTASCGAAPRASSRGAAASAAATTTAAPPQQGGGGPARVSTSAVATATSSGAVAAAIAAAAVAAQRHASRQRVLAASAGAMRHAKSQAATAAAAAAAVFTSSSPLSPSYSASSPLTISCSEAPSAEGPTPLPPPPSPAAATPEAASPPAPPNPSPIPRASRPPAPLSSLEGFLVLREAEEVLRTANGRSSSGGDAGAEGLGLAAEEAAEAAAMYARYGDSSRGGRFGDYELRRLLQEACFPESLTPEERRLVLLLHSREVTGAGRRRDKGWLTFAEWAAWWSATSTDFAKVSKSRSPAE